MFRKESDLPDMIGGVGDPTVDGLHRRVRLGPDEDRLAEILHGEAVQGPEQAAPSLLPGGQESVAAGSLMRLELGVTVAVRLLSIGGEEVGPSGSKVARQVLEDHGQAVRLGIQSDGEVLIPDLNEGFVRELLELAGLNADVLKEEIGRVGVH